MNQELLKSLSKYVEITKELEVAINESAFIQNFKTGTILLKVMKCKRICFLIISLGIISLNSFAQEHDSIDPRDQWMKYNTPEEAGFSTGKLDTVW